MRVAPLERRNLPARPWGVKRAISGLMRLGIMLAVLAAVVACSASSSKRQRPAEQSFTMFVTADLRGTIEPCGCTSDPLGDIARTAELIATARAAGQPVLVVDGGSLLYSETVIPEYLAAQEALKADLVHDIYTRTF